MLKIMKILMMKIKLKMIIYPIILNMKIIIFKSLKKLILKIIVTMKILILFINDIQIKNFIKNYEDLNEEEEDEMEIEVNSDNNSIFK